MKQPSREITPVIDRACWNIRLSEHKCSITWNIILSLNWTCRGIRTECTWVKQLLLGLFRSLESDQASEVWGKLYREGRSAVKNQAAFGWWEWAHGSTHERWSSFVILSAKDSLYLSLTLLKKRMLSPIRKFAQKESQGAADLVFLWY